MDNNNTIEKTKKVTKSVNKKARKKIKKIIIIVLVIIAILAFILNKMGLFKSLGNDDGTIMNTLTTYTVSRRNITQSLTSSGTLQPNDSYTITPLVSGEILADFFDEGDIVQEDQLLYQVDSANIESNIKRARNSLKDAQKSLNDAIEDRDNLNVKSNHAGVIEKLYVEIGDEVGVGAKIADIADKSTMCIDIPFMAVEAASFYKGQPAELTFSSYETLTGVVDEIGNTTSVNELGVLTRIVTIKVKNTGGITPSTTAYASVGDATCTAASTFYYNDEGQVVTEIAGEVINIYFDEGDTVSKNSVIVVLKSEDLNDRIEKLERNVEDAQSSLDDALDNYDNYNITSPISGTVISKEYKAGDTLGNGGGNSGSASMAVIYDMSAFKFTMNIDELDIDKIKLNQEVIVTSDARIGKEYYGTVTNISIQGSTSNGTTVYPVTVTIDNVEDEARRVTDEDGTIHKYYKTGKTGTVKQYILENVFGNTYTYADGISIEKNVSDNGNVLLKCKGKDMILSDNGSYTLGSDIYNIGEDMQTLSVETVDESSMLRPGMNIDAEILVQNVQNVIAVPVSAIMRGYTVKVISRAEQAETVPEKNYETESKKGTVDKSENENLGNVNGGRGTVPVDTEYEEVTVKVGVTDNNYIEITDGLNVGDVIILDEVNSILSSGTTTNTMQGFGGMGGGMGGFGGGPMMGGGGGMSGMRPGGR